MIADWLAHQPSGIVHRHPHHQGQLYCVGQARCREAPNSTVLPRQGSGWLSRVLPSFHLLSWLWDQLSRLPQEARDKARSSLPHLCHHMPHVARSPPAGSALLCFPGKGQAQLLVLVRCRASSPTLMTSEAALLSATGSKVGRTSCSPIDCFTYKIVKENCHISIMYMIHNNQK